MLNFLVINPKRIHNSVTIRYFDLSRPFRAETTPFAGLARCMDTEVSSIFACSDLTFILCAFQPSPDGAHRSSDLPESVL